MTPKRRKAQRAAKLKWYHANKDWFNPKRNEKRREAKKW